MPKLFVSTLLTNDVIPFDSRLMLITLIGLSLPPATYLVSTTLNGAMNKVAYCCVKHLNGVD